MHFHIVKMYKDKQVKKNVKNMFLSICDVKVFLTFTFTEYDKGKVKTHNYINRQNQSTTGKL
jgi:hypothetical protein